MLTQKKNYGHYLFLLCVACALFINYFFSNDLLSVVVTIVCCLYFLVIEREHYASTAIFITFYAYLFRYGDYG